MEAKLRTIWLRSFFGFSPEEDGYIGWSKDANRKHVLSKASSSDLMTIFSPGLFVVFLIVHSLVATMSNKPSLSK
ncbi:hypothetical protein [uncultured Roseobacter sp.]|uniref:hypothetical protein n=1 Tax=uncultured Roseobacter sp. TaxID=114847 RepID=UPI002626170F|nr:hypothetical protein [uncultured Roseobacter sp.]